MCDIIVKSSDVAMSKLAATTPVWDELEILMNKGTVAIICEQHVRLKKYTPLH